MSSLHAEFGHFSRPVKRALTRMYKVCPCCGKSLAHFLPNFDHIFPLTLWDQFPQTAKEIFPEGMHNIDNGWIICAGPGSCHAQKSAEEYAAARDGKALLKVAEKWYRKAYDKKGKRNFWGGEVKLRSLVARLADRDRRLNATADRASRVPSV